MNGSVRAAIAFGSNLGDRAAHVAAALARIAAQPGLRLVAGSRARETEPVGGPPQGPYLNGALLVETTLGPRELLAVLLDIERQGGRERGLRDGPRTIDLDLLFHGETLLDEPGLTLPHPRLHLRRFVLEPLAEVAPDWRHSRLGATAAELLLRLSARAACAGSR
ncbi:MAG: 2-amino-4-hydroxy-6-hydroxymethyldihydropteridine diphosphokinase [Planctomycetes bacterium]|nr:2-amino-4-hydroxy-6-hydroxymethyldihydropteridine diphosphokinase [Planctomycetota bacterium]